jgi:hypothetical protein
MAYKDILVYLDPTDAARTACVWRLRWRRLMARG